MNQKSFASVVLVAVVVILLAIGGYFALSKKPQKLSIATAPAVSYATGQKPYIQITFDYTVAEKFNIYRSISPDGVWQKIISDFPASAHTAVDYDFPKDAVTLYYRIIPVDKNGLEGISSPVASVTIDQQNETTGWKTYTNQKYGFEFKFSNDLLLYEGSNVENANQSYIPTCDQDSLACSVYLSNKNGYENTNFGEAGFSVRQVVKAVTENQCKDFYPETVGNPAAVDMPQLSGQQSINSIVYYTADLLGGGLGHWSGDKLYRTFHDSICYELDLNISGGNIGVFEGSGSNIKEFNREHVQAILDGVLSTFKFTK